MSLLGSATVSLAADIPLFGPKRYERTQGKPLLYTETFTGCSATGAQAVIKVQNGSSKASSLSSAVVSLNGSSVFSESDFKNQTPWLEKIVSFRLGSNTLTVELKSGGQQETPFLVINVLGRGCDVTPPIITTPQPADGALLNIAHPGISASYADNPGGTGIDSSSVRVTMDSGDITSTCTAASNGVSCLPSSNLAEGGHTVRVVVSDLSNNSASLDCGFTTDTVAPSLAVTSPADGLLTRNHQLTVTGTVSEPLTSLAVNGQTVTVDSMAFTTTVTLTEGVNNIILEATDRAGNKGAVTFNVTLDSTPPTVPALEALTTTVNSPIVVVKGSAEPGSSVALSAGGVQLASTTADAAGQFSFAGLTLTEGENIFTAQATDLAGNAGPPSAPLAVTLDTKAPVVSVIAPLDKAILNTRVVTVTGSIDDPTAAVTVNSLLALNSGGVWTLEGFTLQEGSNALLVEARDLAGNKGSATAAVILDTVPPAVMVGTPVDRLYTNIPRVTVTGTVNEDVASVKVNGTSATLSAGSAPVANTTFTAALTLTEGGNSIVVTAVDRAGNSASSTVTATLDTVAPQLTVIGPADGALLNNGQITFGGAAAEPVASVLVNGIVAQVGTDGGYTLPVTLAEGSNTLTVTAIDRAGNSSTNTITVNLDSTAPAAPLLNAQVTPTRIAITTVAGQAEANSTVTVFNNGVTVATLKADAAGSFSVADVTLTEGTNLFTAQAADAAGNVSPLSAPLSLVLDTKVPVITVTTPQAGALVSAAQVTINGMVDEPLVSLTVNGASTPLSAGSSDLLTFEYILALTAGENSTLIAATDLAGNVATITITVQRDSTPPKVVIVTPLNGLLTNTSQIQISGTVDDADATVTVGGALVSVVNKAFSVGYLLSDGDNNIQVKAVDKAGNEGTAAVTVTLDAQTPVVTLAAPATATAGTDVQITINAEDNRNLTLVDLSADGASLWSAVPNATTASQSVSLRLPPTLNPGATVTVRCRALDAAGNSGSATAVITIDKGADGPGWLQGKTLDDSRGLPLVGAQVSVTDSKGQQQSITIPADGAWFFELASGAANVEVTKNGYTSVRRDVTVRPGQRTSVLDSRLTKIDDTIDTVDATGGTVKSTPFKIQNSSFTIDVSIPAAAFAAPVDVRLTPLSNQGLIAPLPLGWSPLAVADVRMLDPVTAVVIEPLPLTAAATLMLPLPKGLGDTALTAHLARYDSSSRSWLAASEVAIAANATTVGASISQPGQYALVLADPAPLNPPAPAADQELSAVTLQPSDFSLISTTGRVVHQAALPSVGLRAAGDLLLVARTDAASAPALISGLVVNARITEKFDLPGGDKLQPAATVQDLVLYRTPCATSIAGGSTEPLDPAAGLRTTFPVSPSRDFTIVDLLLGKISIEITPPDTSGGIMVGSDGARLLQPDGTVLNIPAGALSGTAPVTVATLPTASVSALVGDDFRLLRGVDIAIGGQSLKSVATLSIPVPSGFDPALPVVVAKKFDVKGGSRLKLVAAGTVTGSIISSTAAIPAGNETIPAQGISTSGQYLFLQATAPIGYVTGQVTDATAAPFAAIQVSAQNATLADQTAANGSYLLAMAAAAQNITALDPTRGDAASGSVTIAANTRSVLNLTVRMVPPTVTAITPANGAINVQTDVAVTVTFSKPMDKSTVTNDTFIVRDASTVIPGVITWNAEATVATFYPAEAFKQEKTYSVTIATIAKDMQGYSLGQNVSSSFTVRRTTPPTMPAAGAISGTFPDADGYITVTATQGSAAADNTVLLINDTTGEIQSVTPQSNGSFTGKVRGQLGDQIKVVLMDHSGNQTTISYLTFKGPDGSYLVTAKGGKVEGEGGSLLEIPDGALAGAAIVRLTRAAEENLPYPIPEKGKYLGAINIDTGGINFQKEVHLSIPVPVGFDTNTAVFVTRPSTIYNGDDTTEQVYEIVDSTKVINGRITTASPPFDGIFAFGIFAFVAFPTVEPVILSGYTYQEMNDLGGYQDLPAGIVDTPILDLASGTLTYKYDRLVAGAVIRSPWAMNYVSYSNSKGFYATFSSLVASIGVPCKDYTVAATNPYTMQRKEIKGQLCEPPNNVERFNFKLGDKGTIPPDKTKPTIEATVKVAPGMGPDFRIVSGSVPVNTKLLFPVSVTDEGIRSTTLVVNFKGDDGATVTTPVSLVRPAASVIVRSITRGIDVPVYRTDYITQFNSDPTMNYFLADQPGVYTFFVEATDQNGNMTTLSRSIRVAAPGGVLPTGKEGAPTVDAVSPINQSKNIPVTSSIVATFSEPVGNVTENTFKLLDLSAVPATNDPVLASVSVTLVGNRTVAKLTPKSNLWFGHSYKVVLTTGIKDENINTTAPSPYAPPDGDGKMPLVQQYETTFTTVMPEEHDLDADEQFSGGRDIDLYDFTTSSGDQKTYAYVAAGDNGWRVMDVSDPSTPSVLSSKTLSSAGVSWAYRGVSVNQDTKILGMTDSITYSDGNQYGYLRFYDLNANPETPQIVGREKLAEAYSGIPGRLALFGDYAYVATTVAGIQVVDVKAAIDRQRTGGAADGSTIVSVFDSMGQGYGSPNDVAVFNAQKALVTTNSGYLLPLDITTPYYPILMTAYRPSNTNFIRTAIAPAYEYTDENGMDNKIDLAVAGTRDGRLVTIDMTDAYNPTIIGTATNDVGSPITTTASDISIVPKEWLAFVTTLNTIKVFDIKDPRNPKLRNEYEPQAAADLNETTPPAAIGSTPAIIARDGWLYMANMSQGLRTMGVNVNDIKVYNENKIQITEIGYSKGKEEEDDRRYYVEVKFDDPDINCNDDDLEGSIVIRTREGAYVNPLPGIGHPTKYLLSFRKDAVDGNCYADLKETATSPVKKRFIATNFPVADLTLTTTDGIAIAPVFGSIGTKAEFEFSSRNDGRLMRRKSINLEKLIRIAFDGNRDGKINFDDPEDMKYTFWVNDDHDTGPDVRNGEVGLFDDDLNLNISDSNTKEPIDQIDQINTLRDLEDFAQVHIKLDKHARNLIKLLAAQRDIPPSFSYQLQFKNVNGTNPSINLFEAVTDGTKFQSEYKTALLQLYNKRIATINSTSISDLPAKVLKGAGTSHFIFEGQTSGTGNLAITLNLDGVTLEESTAKLDLKPITWFYDKYQVGYEGTGYNVSTNYTTSKGGYHPKDNDYVFYVHGWNMENGEVEKERWAETMFKRLWWQGYTGKVGLFSWPTLGLLEFDESEARAWNSAEGFKNLLLSSDMADYQGRIRILGHSMGGIVAGETINKLPGSGIVHTYIATQAALSAHFYDNRINEKSLAAKYPGMISTPNVFGYYMSGNETTSDKPYLSSSTNKAIHINYFNPLDFALSRGDVGFAAWELNNFTRPDYSYRYVPLASIYLNGVLPLQLPGDRYEIFSRIIQSRAKAVGAVSSHIDNFNDAGSKNLSELFDYDKKHYSHSRQFRSTILQENGYWNAVMSDFSLRRSFK